MQILQELCFEDIVLGMDLLSSVCLKGKEDDTVICAGKAHMVTTAVLYAQWYFSGTRLPHGVRI